MLNAQQTADDVDKKFFGVYIDESPKFNYNWRIIPKEEGSKEFKICLAQDQQGNGLDMWSLCVSDIVRDPGSNFVYLSKDKEDYWEFNSPNEVDANLISNPDPE